MKKLSFLAVALLMATSLFAQDETAGVYADNVTESGCLSKTRSEGVMGRTHIRLTRDGNTLSGELIYYYVNCAMGKISVKCEENNQTLNIRVAEDLGELAADCMCPVNISFTIHNVTGSHYQLVLNGRSLGNISFDSHSVVEIDLDTLEQAYEEGFDYPVKLESFEIYEITKWIKPDEPRQPQLELYYYGEMFEQVVQYLNYCLPTDYTYLGGRVWLDEDNTLVAEVITDGSSTKGSQRVAHLSMYVANVESPLTKVRLIHRVVALNGDDMTDKEVLVLYDGDLSAAYDNTVNLKELSEYRKDVALGVEEAVRSMTPGGGQTVNRKCFDLQGREIINRESSNRQLNKGFYILGGKKVIVK